MNENAAAECFCALLQQLEEQWRRSVQENAILQGPDFPKMRAYMVVRRSRCSGQYATATRSEAALCFQENFQAQPLNLAAILSECLKEEKQILESVTMTMVSPDKRRGGGAQHGS